MKRRHWPVAFALTVTCVFLALALRNVRFSQLWEVLAGARWRWIAAMVAVTLLDLLIRSLRWRLLLSRAAAPRWSLMFRLESIGLAVNNVLFMRLGELARAFLASRELGVALATAVSSVVVERVLDVAALLSIFCVAAEASPALVPRALLRGAAGALLAVVAGLALLVAAEAPLAPGRAWERRLRAWPKIHELVSQLAAGAAVLREGPKALAICVLSLSLWTTDALLYWAGARALDLGRVMDYARAVLVLSWAGVAGALPAAPGAFGTFEAMVKSILVLLGALPEQALGYAVFTHMMMYLVVTGLGLVFLYQEGLSLAELTAALERGKDSPGGR